jgi:hypothetical protein
MLTDLQIVPQVVFDKSHPFNLKVLYKGRKKMDRMVSVVIDVEPKDEAIAKADIREWLE